MAHSHADRNPTFAEPPAYFEEALKDAERLLKYAAELGIPIEDHTRDHILQARAASVAGWTRRRRGNCSRRSGNSPPSSSRLRPRVSKCGAASLGSKNTGLSRSAWPLLSFHFRWQALLHPPYPPPSRRTSQPLTISP